MARAARDTSAVFDLERILALSRDLFCIVGTDGYLKSVNPAVAAT